MVASKASAPVSSRAQLAGNAALEPESEIVSSVLKQLNYFPASILFTCLLYDITYELTEVVINCFPVRF